MESSKSPSYDSSPSHKYMDQDENDDRHHSDSDNRSRDRRDRDEHRDFSEDAIVSDEQEDNKYTDNNNNDNSNNNGNTNNSNNENENENKESSQTREDSPTLQTLKTSPSSDSAGTPSSTNTSTNNNNNNNTSTANTTSSKDNSKDSDLGNLFVNFLPSTITTEDLKNMFSAFGPIESCRVMIDLMTGQSRGFGFVKFKDNNNAMAAIKAMNGAKIDKKTLLVRHANAENSIVVPPQVDDTKATNNIYIKGLPLSFTQEQLNEFFSAYGTILESKLLLDITTNSSRGQALVRFADVISATKAIKALLNYKFPSSDKQVIVRYADNEEEKVHKRMKTQQKSRTNLRFSPYPSPTTTPLYPAPTTFYQMNYNPMALPKIQSPVIGGLGMDPTNLYVYNLPADADDALLYRLFSPSGAIASVKVVKDPITQACKGFGFVRMVNLQDSVNAINSVNGVTVEGKVLQVSFKK